MPSPSSAPSKPLPWRVGLAYGGLGVPLAFVSLPLYVNLPHHYAAVAGVPLAGLGAVLLATRALDAVLDPALGRMADRLLKSGLRAAWLAAVLGSVLMALGFAALWHPPNTSQASQASLLGWLAASLLLCTLAYSAVSILHQAWGTRWGGEPDWRARVTAWREGATLAGVLLASVLPTWLGFDATSLVLMMALALGLLGLHGLQRSSATPAPTVPLHTSAAQPSPWADASFRRLLAVFMLNGVAAAIPATLLPFFVMDRLQAPDLQPLLLLCYFGAAAAGLPLWVKAVARWGLAPSWRAGMLASVIAFSITPWLGAGDSWIFILVCLASGLALGADLALPGALLTGVIHESGHGGCAEGRYLGWWACAAKLNLALAAGLCLPLLAAMGYHSGTTDPAGLQALAWAYGGLPCLFKLMAWACLWRAERLHSSWRLK